MSPNLLAIAAAAQQAATTVPHPEIPCWSGERSWSAPGDPPSDFVVFSTEGEALAVTIEHHRDQFRQGRAVEQNYNYLDYRFATRPALRVRVYLHDPMTALVASGHSPIRGLAELRAAAGDEVLCYLQKRFEAIETFFGNRGYRPVWRARER